MAKHTATIAREQQIIAILKKDPVSLKGLEEATGFNYYTVRQIVNSLMERGIVKVHSTHKRANRFIFNADNVENHDYIPRITHLLSKSAVKVIYLLESVGSEDDMKATQAARNLPKHATEMMRLANMAHHGADVSFMLNSLRDAMQRDFLYIKNFSYLYEQMLNEPRLWNVKALQEMPNDSDFNFAAVQEAVDYYAD